MPHEQKGAQALNNDEISQKIVALLSEIEAQSYLNAPFREPTMDIESQPSASRSLIRQRFSFCASASGCD